MFSVISPLLTSFFRPCIDRHEGKWAALGVGTGAMLPMLPVFAGMLLKRELTGRTFYVVGGTSVLLFTGTFVHSYMRGNEG